ncbi:MAG: hypothetical protein ABI581_02545 [Sediminibacterium sp.]
MWTIVVAIIAFVSFFFLLFTAHGSFERGTIGHFIHWLATGIVHLLAIPMVFVFEKANGLTSKPLLFIGFAIDCILYGFLIERVITMIRSLK